MSDYPKLLDGELFRISEDGKKITLSVEARQMARLQGMSDQQLAEHLLNQNKLREAGLLQKMGASQ